MHTSSLQVFDQTSVQEFFELEVHLLEDKNMTTNNIDETVYRLCELEEELGERACSAIHDEAVLEANI